MKEIRNKTFKNETVVLDGKKFIDCSFQDCELVYSGGLTAWTGTKFQKCRLHLRGAAEYTRQVFQMCGMLNERAALIALVDLSKKPN